MSGERDPLVDLLREVVDDRVQATRPGALLGEIVEEVHGTPQRRRGWWPLGGSSWAAPSFAVAIALVIAVIGLTGLINRPTGPGASSPSPSPTTSSLASPASIRVLPSPSIDALPLPAGRYQTAVFAPALQFQVPDGVWTAAIDAPRQLLLRARLPGEPPNPEFDALAVVVIDRVYVNSCARPATDLVALDPGDGPTIFLDWLEETLTIINGPPVSLGPRTPVTILGADGLEVEFTSPDVSRCAGNSLSITDTGAGVPLRTPLAGTPVRYAVIDLDGRTVLIATVAHEPARRDAVWAAADDVIGSLELAP
jgi:hypothetical protein